MITRRLFSLLVGALAFGSALGASFSAGAETLAEIRERGTLRVGVGIMGLKPYIWQNPDGSYAGLEHDILQYVLKEIDVPNYEYVLTEWQTLIPGLKSGRWDIIMSGLGFNQERLGVGGIAFARPHLLYVDYVIVSKDSPIQSLEDLKDKTVASVVGSMDSLNAHNLQAEGKIGEVVDFNGWGEPFIALRNQQVDAVVIDQMTYLGQVAELDDLRLIGEPMLYQPKPEWADAESKADYKLGAAGIFLRSDDEELRIAIDKAIEKMFSDGTHEKILKSYGAWDPSQANPMK